MNNIDIDTFKITTPIRLSERDSNHNLEASKKEIEKELKQTRKKLGDFQDTMYAHGKYAVLLCLQGMDTSGKDSLVREVFKDFNARGVVVHSFKVPSQRELKHDFLWRHYLALPERGKFGVFNRTHYENVLVTKVHPEYILNENIPGIQSVNDIDSVFWEKRYQHINNFESHLANSGTLVFKFFLHLSKKEQKNRLLRRLNKPEKNWKFSPDDLAERKLWQRYQECYQEAINKTSKPHAPWFVIPADDKPTARLLVAQILYQTLSRYTDIKEPTLDSDTQDKVAAYRKMLNDEK